MIAIDGQDEENYFVLGVIAEAVLNLCIGVTIILHFNHLANVIYLSNLFYFKLTILTEDFSEDCKQQNFEEVVND